MKPIHCRSSLLDLVTVTSMMAGEASVQSLPDNWQQHSPRVFAYAVNSFDETATNGVWSSRKDRQV